jgi:mono/diheme cytochrome c family protein
MDRRWFQQLGSKEQPRIGLLCVLILFGLPLVSGCRQDMHNQPKFIPQRGSAFFPDGRSVRPQVEGTVARSQPIADTYFLTGMQNGKEGDGFPVPVTLQTLERGQERFNIFCTPCHSRVGDGHGILVMRGYYEAANFHSERLRQAPAGHFFNVISHGMGVMPQYGKEISPADRWAIVAYIRALQLSQRATRDDAAGAASIATLSDIAARQGLPASFADTSEGAPLRPPLMGPTDVPKMQPDSSSAPNGAASTSEGANGAQVATNKTGAPDLVAKNAKPAAPGNPAAGKQVFVANCQVCHQPNRAGMPPMIPSLVDIVKRTSEGHVRQTVTKGVPTGSLPMPPFGGKLSAGDMDNLIAFLKTKP